MLLGPPESWSVEIIFDTRRTAAVREPLRENIVNLNRKWQANLRCNDTNVRADFTIPIQEELEVYRWIEQALPDIRKEMLTERAWKYVCVSVHRPGTVLIWVDLQTRRLSFQEELRQVWIEENWRYNNSEIHVRHRPTGPACFLEGMIEKTEEKEWWIMGKVVPPFDKILAGEESWEEYLAKGPDTVIALAELRRHGLIHLNDEMYENLKTMQRLI